jgi:hypothetical protein
MKLEPLAKYDPSQEVLVLNSSTGSSPFPQEEGPQRSTSGCPSQQLFGDPSRIPSLEVPPSDPNPLHLDATALQGNCPMKEESVTPVVFLKREPIVQNRFVPLQKWEGTVLQVLEDSFFARLVDITSGGADEEAEFPMEEVSDADWPLITPGAVFYWNIGYIDNISGQRTRASVIRFRRLPVWRQEELGRAKRKAQHISDLLDWK